MMPTGMKGVEGETLALFTASVQQYISSCLSPIILEEHIPFLPTFILFLGDL